MHYNYKTQGTCSTAIEFDIDGNVITNVKFTNGCKGNLKAIGRLVEGMTADEINEKLAGNICGFKKTSCADQLAKAVMKAKEEA
ncbi:MAG: TIGR03905 family TSCPD domain-containing protein [Treponema sp.]|nr:TIGR03905 family TSCPD domain-containing protein [Treponema sp.]